MTRSINRRGFLHTSAVLGTAGCFVGHTLGQEDPKSPNEKLDVALIGCGGRGGGNLGGVKGENIVALCDVDESRAAGAFKDFPKAEKFADFREMLDKVKCDAVVVSTPDHMHAIAALSAMELGKHLYCEKPLTWSVEEARLMRLTAKRMKVATQMGNQGTSQDGLRRAVEVVRAGQIGPVTEVHVWTNRPGRFWKQGWQERPKTAEVPNTLSWDLWQGVAEPVEYSRAYVPFAWRGWWDYGTGALGDMACHTANMAYMALKLGAPTRVSAKTGPVSEFSPPTWSTITYEFPERDGMPAVKVIWYDGVIDGKQNLPSQELAPGEKFTSSGSLLVGGKGTLFSPNDYGASFKLLGDAAGTKPPEKTLPRSKGHHREWIDACKGGPAAMSNFDYAGPLTEFVLLGNVASRAGEPIEWDAEELKVTNSKKADALIRREYRKGWELPSKMA